MIPTSIAEVDVATLDIAHHFGGGVYAKETRIKAGEILVQHRHAYAHLSILASGTVLFSSEGHSAEVSGPMVLTIEANVLHRVQAITNCVWFCIHATQEIDPARIDDVLIVPSSQQEMRELAMEAPR